jgi:hypothetical protein
VHDRPAIAGGVEHRIRLGPERLGCVDLAHLEVEPEIARHSGRRREERCTESDEGEECEHEENTAARVGGRGAVNRPAAGLLGGRVSHLSAGHHAATNGPGPSARAGRRTGAEVRQGGPGVPGCFGGSRLR